MNELTAETATILNIFIFLKIAITSIETTPPDKLKINVGPKPEGLNRPPKNSLIKPTAIPSFQP